MNLPRLYIPGCPHRPTRKQWIALSLPGIREILYGGAAGGGKSDFLLMAALQYIDQPGYSAVIFRRTFPQLAAPEDGLMARALEWLGPDPDFQGVETIHGMPVRWKRKGGGTLSFSHLQYEKDKFSHQGPSYQFIGWDELTQFLESQYRYLLSRLRRLEGSTIPLRVRAASNPGGEGHDWVRERFVEFDEPSIDRLYIPARLSDNPHLDAVDYERQLRDGMHPYDLAQLLDGNWNVRPPGSRFKREWFEIVDAVPASLERTVRRWDLAATEPKKGRDPDWTAGCRMSRQNGSFYITDIQRFRSTPAGVDARLLQSAELDGRGVAVRIEQEPGATGKIAAAHFSRILAGFDIRSVTTTGDKIVNSNPLASQAEAGNVKIVRGPWVEEFLRELEMFPQGSHDDQVDAASHALADLTQRGVSPSEAIEMMEGRASA